MYYIITGHTAKEFMRFESVIRADSEEAVRKQLDEDEICQEIRKVDPHELLQRGQDELKGLIENDYFKNISEISVREYVKRKAALAEDEEEQYEVLEWFMRRVRLFQGLMKEPKLECVSVKEFKELFTKLFDAETEEEFQAILRTASL